MRAQPARNRIRYDDGAILIHVAIAVMVLAGFSAFVLDYGVMWLSRRQAQNAADAGALAGAVARAFDETADPPPAGGKAFSSAFLTAQANPVWNEAPVVNVTWTCPGGGTTCVTVDVFRDRANGNALPTFFAPILGVTSQQVRATATARAVPANATDCMRPLAISDKWQENQTGPWDTTDTFDRWQNVGGSTVLVPNPDVYTPPTPSDIGTGFSVGVDYGTQVTLPLSSYQPVVVPGIGGAQPFNVSLDNCTGSAVGIGQYLPVDSSVTDAAVRLQAWITEPGHDGGASWDSGSQTVTGSCAPGCAPFSPRIFALALFDPDEFQFGSVSTGGAWAACPTAAPCVHIRNIVGFFVSTVSGTDITGYLIRYPGVLTGGGTSVGADSAFNVAVTLVR